MTIAPGKLGSLQATAGAVPRDGAEGSGGAGAKPSITDFLTDGSLAGLCAELSRLTGATLELHDPRGHAIERLVHRTGGGATGAESAGASDANGGALLTSWRVGSAPSPLSTDPGASKVAIMLGADCIGTLVLGPTLAEGAGVPLPAEDRARVLGVLDLLAKSASELCQHEVELRHRIKEVGALARMSSLLTRGSSSQKVLDVALDLALDVLGLEAGSIVLLRDEEARTGPLRPLEEDLVLATARGLTTGWLEHPEPLSKERLFDREALAGAVVTCEDIAIDPRIHLRERALQEGLRAAIQAGLVFKNRPLGVIRLYAKQVRTFDDADQKLLASLAAQAAAALEQSRLMALEQEEQALQRQLQLAADVQRRMLPRSVPTHTNLDVAARYIPSFELGGDFYDFLDLNGHLGIAVGDVVGKGIAAALLMSSVRASLRAYAQDVYDLDEIVSRVNTALCRDTRENEFASLWYGVIDPAKMRLTYCSAGHEPPMVVRVPKHRAPNRADIDELSVGGMVVGVDASQRYQRAVFEIRAGDVVLAYTDGISDSTNFSGERFGKSRIRDTLLRCLSEKPHASAGDIVERLLWEVRQFSGLSKARSDDKTVVALRVR